MNGIRVTATDLANTEESMTAEIMDDYVLVCAGTAHRVGVDVEFAADGTQTHVITVSGVRRS